MSTLQNVKWANTQVGFCGQMMAKTSCMHIKYQVASIDVQEQKKPKPQVRACMHFSSSKRRAETARRAGWVAATTLHRCPRHHDLAARSTVRETAALGTHTHTQAPKALPKSGTRNSIHLTMHGYSRSSGIQKLHTYSSYPRGFERSQSRGPVG